MRPADLFSGFRRNMGALLHAKLHDLARRVPQIGSVDGKGLVAGLACVSP